MEFVLGVMFGSGLVLALQELDLRWTIYRDNRLSRAQDQAITQVTEQRTEDSW